MNNSPDRTPAFVKGIARVLEYIGALLLFCMMVLTFVDVVGRYLFSSPVPGGFEMTEIMLATLIFVGLPLITLRDGHVTVALIEGVLPDAFRRWRDRVVFVGAGVILLFLCSRLWIKASDMLDYNDQTAVLNIPLFPVAFAMVALTGLSGLISIVLGLVGHRTRNDNPALES